MYKIFKKDIKLFFQDRKSLLVSFLLPLILISLLGFIFKNDDGNKQNYKPIRLLICDLDSSLLTKKLIASLSSAKNLEIIPAKFNESVDLINKGSQHGVLIFYRGFQDSLERDLPLPLEIKYDKAHELEIRLLQSIIINKLLDSLGNELYQNRIKLL